jgi:hypothetical protein
VIALNFLVTFEEKLEDHGIVGAIAEIQIGHFQNTNQNTVPLHANAQCR